MMDIYKHQINEMQLMFEKPQRQLREKYGFKLEDFEPKLR